MRENLEQLYIQAIREQTSQQVGLFSGQFRKEEIQIASKHTHENMYNFTSYKIAN